MIGTGCGWGLRASAGPSKAEAEALAPARGAALLTGYPADIPRNDWLTVAFRGIRLHVLEADLDAMQVPELLCLSWWQVLGSNQRRRSRRFYRPLPLAARATCLAPPQQDAHSEG